MDNMMNYTINELNNELYENNDNNVMMMMMMYNNNRDDVVVDDYHQNNDDFYHDNSLDMKYRSINLASAKANHSSSSYEHNMMYTTYNNNKYSTMHNFPSTSSDVHHAHSYSQSRELKEEGLLLCPVFDETIINIISKKKHHIINITTTSSDDIINNNTTNNDRHYHHYRHDKDQQQVIIELVTTCLMTIVEFDFSAYLPNDFMVSSK